MCLQASIFVCDHLSKIEKNHESAITHDLKRWSFQIHPTIFLALFSLCAKVGQNVCLYRQVSTSAEYQVEKLLEGHILSG